MSVSEETKEATLEWLSFATQDLRAAESLMDETGSFTSQICFLSQQAAEKAIKAGLIFLQREFPFSHDLDKLRNLLPKDWDCYQKHTDLEVLSDWAVGARYPSVSARPSLGAAVDSLQQARNVIDSITKDLRNKGLVLNLTVDNLHFEETDNEISVDQETEKA